MEVTVRELALMIKEGKKLPKDICVLNGTVTLSEGANIKLFDVSKEKNNGNIF